MNLEDNNQISEVLLNIIHYSDDAIIVKDTKGVITSWNPAAEKIFGYERNEAVGQHISLIIPKERLHEEDAIISRVISNERVDHFETERVRKDKSRIYVSLVISPIKDATGEISGILKIARDITIQRTVAEVQARMADIVNHSDDGILTTTLDGIITSWNRGAERIYGYSTKEIIGRHISVLIPEGRFDEEPQIVDRILKGEYIDHYETQRKKKDSSIIDISLTVSPIQEHSGKIVGISKIARDITARKQADKFLSWFAAIVNHSDDGIISKDLNGTITTWNRAAQQIFGYREEDVVGKHISILIPEGRLDEEPQIIDRIKRGESIDHYETIRLRKDGTVIPVSLTVSPIKDSDQTVVGASKIVRDISERKRREEEILHLNTQLEAFNYSVSHDLKAPLRVNTALLELLMAKHGPDLKEEVKGMIEKLKNNSERMTALIENLLIFYQSGREALKKVLIDMEGMARTIFDELVSDNQNLQMNLEIDSLQNVKADKELIRQVWVNLLSNAIKYSMRTAQAKISVASSIEAAHVVYSVADNGIGFDMENKDKLFTAFQRLHPQRDFEGSGIGLSIVEQIVRRHGAKVWAEGIPNKGAKFFFSLPRD